MKTTHVAAAVLLVLGAVASFTTAATATEHGPQWWPWAPRATGSDDQAPSRTVTAASPDPDATPSALGTAQPTSTATVPSAPGRRLRVYLTGSGWWDNTPPGSSSISNPVLHRTAGGTGTYADPITAAVPYRCADGCLQWPAGTRFYLPSLRRYAIVEDTCGDAPNSCDGSDDNQLVVWVGTDTSAKASRACEDRMTGTKTVIENPSPALAVTPGDIC